MTGERIAVRGGTVVTPNGVQEADVVIRGGVVECIADSGASDVDSVIEAAGCVVLPGALDPHVHLDDLGIAHRETFEAGTAAALLGGITTLFEHPLSVPATTTAERYVAKRELADANSRVDFGLWGALTSDSLDEISGQWAAGARAFKAFVVDSGGIYPHVDDDVLLEGMRRVRKLGGLVLVHCENEAIVAGATRRIRAAGGRNLIDFARSRPPIAEIEATTRVLTLAAEADVRIQIVHVSEPAAAAEVDRHRTLGRPATLEHTMHHLLLDIEQAAELGPWAKCSPPLRDRNAVEALWKRIIAGAPTQLACDHSPYSAAEKLVGVDDVFVAGMGIQSLQESVPFFLDEALYERGLDLTRCADIIAGQAASTLGLTGRKGAITPGADADLTIWRLDDPWVVDPAAQHRSVNPWSPLTGRTCRVRRLLTMVRGVVAADEHEVLALPGAGRFVVPEPPEVADHA